MPVVDLVPSPLKRSAAIGPLSCVGIPRLAGGNQGDHAGIDGVEVVSAAADDRPAARLKVRAGLDLAGVEAVTEHGSGHRASCFRCQGCRNSLSRATIWPKSLDATATGLRDTTYSCHQQVVSKLRGPHRGRCNKPAIRRAYALRLKLIDAEAFRVLCTQGADI